MNILILFYDANTNKYTSKIFNEIYKYIQPLNTKVYRFPGHTGEIIIIFMDEDMESTHLKPRRCPEE